MDARTLLATLPVTACLLLVACGSDPGPGPGPYVDECSDAAGATRPPEVEITSPGNAEAFESSNSINWVISVSDDDTDVGDLEVELLDYSSGTPEDIDISVPNPDSDGRVTFSMAASLLTEGQNPIRARATDPDDCFGEDDVLVCIDQDTCP